MAELTVTPADALLDVPRTIRADGLAAGETVVVASRTRRHGVTWQAQARFVAAADGSVATDRDAPVAGSSYTGVSANGLLWSQVPDTPGEREVFDAPPFGALATEIRLEHAGGRLTQPLLQHLLAPGVNRREIRDDGLVGTLYTPPGEGPHPAVVVLNGSNGGINEVRAALYAAHGYAALTLGYFNLPGLSPYISNTRLEYFEHALAWVHRSLRPRHGFVALSGQSRGGELVLLLASLFPQLVAAVVGYVPGAVVHSAQNACDPQSGRDGPAWLYRGEALPHLWQNNRHATWQPWDEGPEPRRHADALLTALRDTAAVERARIPVERIRGPVLLLSGGDDGSWPSSLYGRMVSQRLAQHAHPYPVEHLDFPRAGHAIQLPYVPTTQIDYRHPVSGRHSTGGGDAPANAEANATSWPAVLRFLGAAVVAHAGQTRSQNQ